MLPPVDAAISIIAVFYTIGQEGLPETERSSGVGV
jgi:hypothetical protein